MSSFYAYLKPSFCFLLFLITTRVFAQTPVISSFWPTGGPVGTLVTVTGTDLSSATAFTIGGTNALIVSNTSTSLVGMVMPGATTGAISVTTAGGSVNSSSNFNLYTTPFPVEQQGPKLVSPDAIGAAYQGEAMAFSADGNTMVVGAKEDNGKIGAALIYVRENGVWTQQGPKLVGALSIGASEQGYWVDISADGNTAIVGGWQDNGGVGAAWIYTRTGTTWTEQAKLVGTGNIGAAGQGFSVGISADGNTAVVSGHKDDGNRGAAWVFVRSGNTWTQQQKLVSPLGTLTGQQGEGVAISADGNTLISGSTNDDMAFVFKRTGNVWAEEQALTGTGSAGSGFGLSSSLSADGNTAIIGGPYYNGNEGSVWVFTRTGVTWTEQQRFTANDLAGNAIFGILSDLSADGNTAIIGGYADNGDVGAAWIFTRSGGVWTQQGNKFVGTGYVGTSYQGVFVSITSTGYTAASGGIGDDGFKGATWVYTYIPPPVITSFSPTSATPGTTVTIIGTDFSNATAVSFGGTAAASFTVNSPTNITAVVGEGSSGAVSITTPKAQERWPALLLYPMMPILPH